MRSMWQTGLSTCWGHLYMKLQDVLLLSRQAGRACSPSEYQDNCPQPPCVGRLWLNPSLKKTKAYMHGFFVVYLILLLGALDLVISLSINRLICPAG